MDAGPGGKPLYADVILSLSEVAPQVCLVLISGGEIDMAPF